MSIYLIEAGLLLVIGPWTSFWDRNYFASLVPGLSDWLRTVGLRAGVTAVGVVTGIAGVRELGGAVAARARRRLQSPTPPAPGP